MPPRKPKLPERQRKDIANAKQAARREAKKESQTEEERRAELDRINELQRALNASKKTPVSQNTRRDEIKIKSQR